MKRYLLFLVALLFLSKAHAQFTTTNMVTSLPYPVVFEIAPDGRYFVSCKGGAGASAPSNAQVRVYNAGGTMQAVLWDFTDSVETYFERGVLGLALDPDFATNHYVYVFYNHKTPAKIRVVRFTETAGVGSNPTVIFEVNDPYAAGNHTGGNIHFRPSDPDHLYISIGDRASVPATAQQLDKWSGKILRIHKDGSIPTDNPFYDDGNPATGNDDRIWSWGHRNAWDFTFSTLNDSLYASENGANTYDEVNMVVKGSNYGWPNCEGISGSCTGFAAPINVWGAPLPAVTGIIHYTSSVFPAYTNHLLVTDYINGDIWDITLGNAPVYDQFVSRVKITGISFASLIDIVQGPEGCLYVLDGGYTPNGKITRICPVGMGLDEKQQETSFSIVPNPAASTISINGIPVESVLITDLSGRVVVATNSATIDISGLPAGVYQVLVNGSMAQKLVKL